MQAPSEFYTEYFGNALTLMNRSESSAEECTGEIFFGTAPSEDSLLFTFMCRSEEWLQAEGITRKPRRRGGAAPGEDSEVQPLPKPEPMEEVVPIGDTDEENKPAVQSKKRTGPVQKRTRADSVTTFERARKTPKHSKNSRITTPTGIGASEKESIRSKVKVEEGSSALKVKDETVEVKVDDLKEIKVRASSIQIIFFPLMCGKGYGRDLPVQKGRKSLAESDHL